MCSQEDELGEPDPSSRITLTSVKTYECQVIKSDTSRSREEKADSIENQV